MKNISIVLFLILISSTFMSAQDYQTVKSDRIAYFSNIYGGVNCIRIDSVEFITDSIFYPFSNIQQIGSDCFAPYGASWIGYEIITRDNGFTVFLNNERDSIKINTNSVLNENWTAYIYPDSSTVLATLLNIDTLTILGQLDSAKTIGFQVYDKSLNPVDDKLNNMSIVLSKNYGMVKTLPFSLFPDKEPAYYDEDKFQEYNLIGLSNPQLGVQNLVWFDVHDYQIGDEVHVKDESRTIGPPCKGYYEIDKIINKYIDRKDYPDSIIYLIERTESKYKLWLDSSSLTFFQDTVISKIVSYPQFDNYPNEPIILGSSAYANSMNDGGASKFVDGMSFQFSGDVCWSMPIVDGCSPGFTYIKGLGGPYYSCSGGIECYSEDSRWPVYYKKGNKTWGTPFLLTTVPENCPLDNIEIYPNPAKDFIIVNVQIHEAPFLLELSDIEGKLVSVNELNANSSEVNIENLCPGFYIYRLSKNGEIIKSGKLIIE